jgi:FkbM family methyltransferase
MAAGLSLYRHTIKRVRFLHQAMHWLMKHTAIPLLETVNGFYTLADDPFWFRLELLTNRHEMETSAQVRQLLKPGMTMLDIGGHVGYYTRLASNLVGTSGRVVAFEPHPRNVEYLRRNTQKFANVTVLQVALAQSEGTAELYDYLMMSASGSLHYDEKIRDVQRAQMSDWDVAPRAKNFEPQKFSVRTARVDDLLAEQGITRVDVVKMDIEGAEMGALRGMTQTIQNSPRLSLVMEYNPLGLQAFDNDPIAALDEVLAMGFSKLYVIENDASLTDYTTNKDGLRQLTQRLVQHMGVVNLLFQRL